MFLHFVIETARRRGIVRLFDNNVTTYGSSFFISFGEKRKSITGGHRSSIDREKRECFPNRRRNLRFATVNFIRVSRTDSTQDNPNYRCCKLQIKGWEGWRTGNFVIPFPVVSRKTHCPWRRMIEFYRHCYICIYIFPALRFITLQRIYIIPNNSIRARSIFPFNPDLSHCVARGNVSRADHLSPPYLERKLNEIARSRYRVKENKKK